VTFPGRPAPNRCVEIISEPGTINNCTFPSGIGKASVASAWATTNVVTECLAGMLDAHPAHRQRLMSVCCGTWDFALLAGVDQRGSGFVTMLCDSMAGGLGARTHSDGVDTGGLACIPMGRVADVEMNEFSFPIALPVAPRGGGLGRPGRYRGASERRAASSPTTARSEGPPSRLSPRQGLALAAGLSGGLPAGTQHDVLLRATTVRADFASGRIPSTLSELGGQTEVLPTHHETDLGATDVYFTHWQGGGGYGDPLLREPEAVAADVIAHKVTRDAANEVYGVPLTADNRVDEAATEARRSALRLSRAGLTEVDRRSTHEPVSSTITSSSTTTGRSPVGNVIRCLATRSPSYETRG